MWGIKPITSKEGITSKDGNSKTSAVTQNNSLFYGEDSLDEEEQLRQFYENEERRLEAGSIGSASVRKSRQSRFPPPANSSDIHYKL